jgi:hypothetical protein
LVHVCSSKYLEISKSQKIVKYIVVLSCSAILNSSEMVLTIATCNNTNKY